MTDTPYEMLMHRVARIERKYRTWQAMGVASLLVVGLVGLGVLLGATGTTIPEEIRAQRFIVVDKENQLKGVLSAGLDGSASLALGDKGKTTGGMLILGTLDGQRGLWMYDQESKKRISLSITQENVPGVSLSDQDGKPRLMGAILPEGKSNLWIFDSDGKPRAVLGGPFSFTDRKTGVAHVWPASLYFLDQDGKMLWRAPEE